MPYRRTYPLVLAPLVVCGCLAPHAWAQRPIAKLTIQGNQRISSAAVIVASGLQVGQVVTPQALDAASQKLIETGIFSTANYRYDMAKAGDKPAYAVTLEVTEETARTPVLLDIPGQDQERLWQGIMAANGLIGKRIPDNDLATTYYKQAIEKLLRQTDPAIEIVDRIEGSISSTARLAVFRPAHLPRVAAIRFEGNQYVDSAILEAALRKAGLGEEYTEHYFARIVELNLRPIYEEKARLTASFPKLKMAAADAGTVAITVEVNEGPLWILGKVIPSGDAGPASSEMWADAKFAEGQPANWKAFLEAVERMKPVLTRDGYLGVRASPSRSFHEDTHVVDVTVEVRKGKQFLFGELHLLGLTQPDEQHAAKMWKLPPADPMNGPYVGEYLHDVMAYLRGRVNKVSFEYRNRPNTNVMDVNITFVR